MCWPNLSFCLGFSGECLTTDGSPPKQHVRTGCMILLDGRLRNLIHCETATTFHSLLGRYPKNPRCAKAYENCSPSGPTTINHQVMTGYIGTRPGHQENDCSLQLTGISQPLERGSFGKAGLQSSSGTRPGRGKGPGLMAFTRISSTAQCTARCRANWMIPPFKT